MNSLAKGSYHKIIRTLEECGAQRSDMNYEITSYIGVLSCNLGSDVLDLFKQIMYSEKFMLDHVACTKDHGLSWRALCGQDIIGLLCTATREI